MVCENCRKNITWGEYKYSLSTLKKVLCFNCQKEERKKTYPDKLADFINDSLSSESSREAGSKNPSGSPSGLATDKSS
jgi:hypothetical protein